MPNVAQPFQFKRFSVQQSASAMKIGFDSILLGAWSDPSNSAHILDVGTGTGVIALMLAQKSEKNLPQPQIDAVEIHAATASEAVRNVSCSPWSSRIRVHGMSFQRFADTCPPTYDLVVCNPPFFNNGRPSPLLPRAASRHDHTLSLTSLCQLSRRIMTSDARLCVVVPTRRCGELVATARRYDLYARRSLKVRPLPQKTPHRMLVEFRSDRGDVVEQQLAIELRRHEYTDAFRELTKDFYRNSNPQTPANATPAPKMAAMEMRC